MHPDQRAFVDAFKAWDGRGMAEALLRIVEELGQVECSGRTREELTWSCRELLELMEGHPTIGTVVTVPEGPMTLILNGGVQLTEAGSPSRHPKVELQLTLSHREPDSLKRRWKALGLVGETIAMGRDEVRTPRPLKGEPGHIGNRLGQPSIHRPPTASAASPSQTYAYALAAEADGARIRRYRRGERERVWDELSSLGARVREDSVLPDAIAVVRETMRRCREDVDRLFVRLRSMGYQFCNPDEAFVPPAADVLARISELERRVGPLPLSLCAWHEIVGSVDFTGSHPGWPEELTGGHPDPLFVSPADYILEYDEENWHRERYVLNIAPDAYHKEDVSGGAPYTIRVPSPAIDAPLDNEGHATTFVDYLRICFRWGGFPGWSTMGGDERRGALLDELTAGLLAI